MVFIFSKVLTDTDVNYRFSIPTRNLESFPPFEEGRYFQFLMAEDEAGHQGRVRFAIRRRKHRRPVLSTGWLRFVRSMRLRKGDEVLFFREVDEATGEVIYRIRPSYIFL